MKIPIDSHDIRVMRDATRNHLHDLVRNRNFWKSSDRTLPPNEKERFYKVARNEIRETIRIIRDINLIFARRDARDLRTEIPKNYAHLRRILSQRRRSAKASS